MIIFSAGWQWFRWLHVKSINGSAIKKNHHLPRSVSSSLWKDVIAGFRNKQSEGISTCANKAQFQERSRSSCFVILWKWNAICKVCKKYSLNYKRVDGSFKQKEIENICWFCTSNSFFFFVDVFERIKRYSQWRYVNSCVYTKTLRVFVLINDAFLEW